MYRISSKKNEKLMTFLHRCYDWESREEKGRTASKLAIHNNDGEILESILENAVINSNAKDEDGVTLLILSAEYGYKDVVRILIDQGANIHEKDNQGHTALMLASKYSNIEIMEFLIEGGADIEARDNEGETALMFAVARNRLYSVNKLIELGANVNAKRIMERLF